MTRAEKKRLERLRLARLARYIVARPINYETMVARADLVLVEPPRFAPEKAFAKYVGDILTRGAA